MYIFVYFEELCFNVLYDLIVQNLFGMFVMYGEYGLDVNYILFLLLLEEGEFGMLYVYVVCVNLVWKDVVNGDEVFVIFCVGDVYILLMWYLSKYEVYRQVLMWNYCVVYVYGCIIVCDDECFVCGVVVCLMCMYEVL